ncbi:MAG: hypothetical protein PVG39_31700 [Desulfobacteraceae bacterium]|jgi:hypothetical protein
MASTLSQKLSYLRTRLTARAILDETGLTAALQREVINEEWIPSGTVRRWVNNLYQSTTYQELRNTGFSHSQAFRFNTNLPDSITEKRNIVSGLISELAGGALKTSLAKQGIAFDVWEHRGLFAEMEEKVKEGFENSRKTYEQWQDYGRV